MPEIEGKAETEDLVVRGDGVQHMPERDMEEWQRDYHIMDLFHTGYVFAPTCPLNMHPAFRLQHSFTPTHILCQTRPGPPSFVALRPLASRTELTFNYGPSVLERLRDCNPSQTSTESDMDYSFSLSGSPHPLIGGSGGGLETTAKLYQRLETRAKMLHGQDERADLAFNIASPTPSPAERNIVS